METLMRATERISIRALLKTIHAKNADIVQWEISKLRFGSDGVWKIWEYEAVLRGKVGMCGTATCRYNSINALARVLVQLPGASELEFFKPTSKEDEPYVSLSDGILTQVARISDKELGELGALVQSYCSGKVKGK